MNTVNILGYLLFNSIRQSLIDEPALLCRNIGHTKHGFIARDQAHQQHIIKPVLTQRLFDCVAKIAATLSLSVAAGIIKHPVKQPVLRVYSEVRKWWQGSHVKAI